MKTHVVFSINRFTFKAQKQSTLNTGPLINFFIQYFGMCFIFRIFDLMVLKGNRLGKKCNNFGILNSYRLLFCDSAYLNQQTVSEQLHNG